MKCPDCDGPMWDNRENKKNPKGPDFKCKDKDCGKAVWLDKKRKDAPQSRENGQESRDDRSSRIERQHSQEMALRYFDLSLRAQDDPPHKGKIPTTAQLRDMISWFQRDIANSPEVNGQPAPKAIAQIDEDGEEIPF